MRTLILFACLTPAAMLANGVYKQVLPDGRVIYSDRPTEGAVQIPIESVQTISPPPQKKAKPVDEAQAPKAPAEPSVPSYESLTISEPKDDSAIRNNAGNVTVVAEVKPRLWVEQGHRLAVELDGDRLAGGFTGTRMELSNVDRGSHDLAVIIVDRDGREILRSKTRRFHLLRHSILFQ